MPDMGKVLASILRKEGGGRAGGREGEEREVGREEEEMKKGRKEGIRKACWF